MKLSNRDSWFIFQNDFLVVVKQDNSLPADADISALKPAFLRHFKTVQCNGFKSITAEIGMDASIPDALHLIPLRQALSFFDKDNYAMAVKAYSILSWDKNHKFCGRCGCLTEHKTQNYERVCTSCGLAFYPRISPSVIVLIRRGDELLMARSPHFNPGVYGLIAGFVDVGECLEDAVHREVMEEVGIKIKNLAYVGSQPWPFPDSLVMAFTADYESGDIVIDGVEIEAAGWYKYDNLPGRPSLPNSVASKLLDEFISSFS